MNPASDPTTDDERRGAPGPRGKESGTRPSPHLEAADICASAPGRVEFIGNHTDYNGGWVLGATLDRRVAVGLTRRDDEWVELRSAGDVPAVRISLGAVTAQSGPRAWANYALGVLAVLRTEGLPVDRGFNLRVESTLPVGAGLSSSAALELAVAFALVEAYGGTFDRKALARLARRAENEFVGVPCGLLDQAVVAFGAEDRLVRVDARTEEVGTVPFPSSTRLWIFRTHETHALADAHYQERHDEAHAVRDRLDALIGPVEHLVDVSPSQLESVKEKLEAPLYRRARHVVTEHRRVERAVHLLERGRHEEVGELLYASHASSRTDYENSTPALDFVVDRLEATDHVLGARLTGAGFGGAVMAWTGTAFGEAEARAVAEAYADRFGHELEVIQGHPAPGAIVHA
ncbi:MAG: galactokinase [Salinibacter sp.]